MWFRLVPWDNFEEQNILMFKLYSYINSAPVVLLYALHHLGSAEESQEQHPEQEVQEIQELNEEHHDLDTNLPECPDHQPSTFTQGKPRSILKSPCFIINLLEYFILCCIKCQELYESQLMHYLP